MKQVTIVGLGYVGLPLICLTAEKGYDVYGVDIDEQKIQLIQQRKLTYGDSIVSNFHQSAKLFDIPS